MNDLSLPHSIGISLSITRPEPDIVMQTARYALHLRLAACLLASMIAVACVAGPEIASSGEKTPPLAGMKPFESGVVNAAGSYIPSDAERALDCKKLTGSMRVIIARLSDTANRPQPSLTASAAQSVAAAVRGKPNVLDMSAEDQRERGRLTAYNALLAEKKCQPLELAKELPAAAKR